MITAIIIIASFFAALENRPRVLLAAKWYLSTSVGAGLLASEDFLAPMGLLVVCPTFLAVTLHHPFGFY